PHFVLSPPPPWDPPLLIHLTATPRCNMRCRGCINSAITRREGGGEDIAGEMDPERDSTAVAELIRMEKGAKEAVLCLYGGEPLLVPKKVAEVMALVAKKAAPVKTDFMLYTNGTLLKKALREAPELADLIWLYSVSIDGRERQHDSVRCGGSLKTIRANLAELKKRRRGEVLMWSTLREEQSLLDCWQEFKTLREEGLADHFFWHWVESDEPFKDLPAYAENYETDLTAIMEEYTAALERGELLSVVHLSELLLYWLTGRERGSSACGVELSRNYDIIAGQIRACADLPASYAFGKVGEDGSVSLAKTDLTSLVAYKGDLGCPRCGVHGYCGGRCPVQALEGNPLRLRQYCQLMRLHVGVFGRYAPRLATALEKNSISLEELYRRSARLTLFTDVTP
ncbi:4Fe-4S cluster-binding domain-containing protein, partial [bacterium]